MEVTNFGKLAVQVAITAFKQLTLPLGGQPKKQLWTRMLILCVTAATFIAY